MKIILYLAMAFFVVPIYSSQAETFGSWKVRDLDGSVSIGVTNGSLRFNVLCNKGGDNFCFVTFSHPLTCSKGEKKMALVITDHSSEEYSAQCIQTLKNGRGFYDIHETNRIMGMLLNGGGTLRIFFNSESNNFEKSVFTLDGVIEAIFKMKKIQKS